MTSVQRHLPLDAAGLGPIRPELVPGWRLLGTRPSRRVPSIASPVAERIRSQLLHVLSNRQRSMCRLPDRGYRVPRFDLVTLAVRQCSISPLPLINYTDSQWFSYQMCVSCVRRCG